MDHLIDRLAKGLGSTKTLHDYYYELCRIHMEREEEVLDYVMRVRDVHDMILVLERRERGEIDINTKRSIEATVMKGLFKGLPSNLRSEIHPSEYGDAETAYDAVSDLTTRHRLDKEWFVEDSRVQSRRQDAYSRRNDYPRQANEHSQQLAPSRVTQRSSNNNNDIMPRPSYRREPRNDNYAPQSTQDSRLWCRYCKIQGHDITVCRRKRYNDELRGNANPGNSLGPANPPMFPRAYQQPLRGVVHTVTESDPNVPSFNVEPERDAPPISD